MKVFQRTGLLALCLAGLVLLLAACGDSSPASSDFTVYVPNGLQPLNTVSDDFRNGLLNTTQQTISDRQVQVYSTDTSLVDLEKDYTDQMKAKGWTDATAGVIGNNELGTNGVVQAYEKVINGDSNKKRVVGVMLLTPSVKGTNNILDKLRTDNGVANTKQLIVIVQAATGQAASTPTPTK